MKVIDKANWPRKGIFDAFSDLDWPFFSLCFPVDVTNLRRYAKGEGLSFYHSLVFLATAAMNEVEGFRVKIRGDGLVLHEKLAPSFTFLKPGRESFQIATLEAGEDLAGFCRRAAQTVETQEGFLDETGFEADRLIYMSCLPWMPLTAISHERKVDPDDSIPRVAWGRYEEKEGRLTLTMGAECNHKLVDGYHVAQFRTALQRRIDAL